MLIFAADLKIGDVIIDEGRHWHVNAAAINPRRSRPAGWVFPGYQPSDPRDVDVLRDMLVDVDATGVGFEIPCKRFSSHKLAEILTVERVSEGTP